MQLNPHHPGWFHFLQWLRAFTKRDYERALVSAYRVDTPGNFWDPLLRAATLGKLGRKEEAIQAYHQLVARRPDFAARHDHYLGCFIHSDDTRTDVLDGLRAAS